MLRPYIISLWDQDFWHCCFSAVLCTSINSVVYKFFFWSCICELIIILIIFQAISRSKFFKFAWSFWILPGIIILQWFWNICSWFYGWQRSGSHRRSKNDDSYAKRNRKVAGCANNIQCHSHYIGTFSKSDIITLRGHVFWLGGSFHIKKLRTRFFSPSLPMRKEHILMKESINISLKSICIFVNPQNNTYEMKN